MDLLIVCDPRWSGLLILRFGFCVVASALVLVVFSRVVPDDRHVIGMHCKYNTCILTVHVK
jgi:hypothetical protein